MPNSEIYFEKNDENNHLTVTIGTERLTMQSVMESNLSGYKQLLGEATNMFQFAEGNSWDAHKTQRRVDGWIKRWKNNNPFSSLAITKNDTEEFIGHAILGDGEKLGSAELAYVFDKKYWGLGYGKESVTTIVQEYAPELVKREYKVAENNFTSIEATSRPDNVGSIKVLTAAGLRITSETFKFGHTRYNFFVTINELMQPQANIVNKNLTL